MVPTRRQQELLVDGYMRNNYIANIPIVLIKLCFLFYNDVFYWYFNGNKLKNFLSIQHDKLLKSDIFDIVIDI